MTNFKGHRPVIKIFMGRMSPFHKGHEAVLLKALSSSDLTICLLGSANLAVNSKNPFSYEHRAQILRNWAANDTNRDRFKNKLVIRPMRDHHSDEKWADSVRSTVYEVVRSLSTSGVVSQEELLRDYDFVIVGSDRDDSTWYLHAFPEWRQDLMSDPNHDYDLSATQVRMVLFEGDVAFIKDKLPTETFEFLNRFKTSALFYTLKEEHEFVKKYKAVYKDLPYPPIFSTVDAVVIHSGHVLLVKRKSYPGKGLLALPGGFVNQSERLVDAAVRELKEETLIPLSEETLKRAVTSKEIFDNPTRSLRGRTITTAFLFELRKTGPLPEVKGSDDAESAFWMPVQTALTTDGILYEDHQSIIETMVDRLGRN